MKYKITNTKADGMVNEIECNTNNIKIYITNNEDKTRILNIEEQFNDSSEKQNIPEQILDNWSLTDINFKIDLLDDKNNAFNFVTFNTITSMTLRTEINNNYKVGADTEALFNTILCINLA